MYNRDYEHVEYDPTKEVEEEEWKTILEANRYMISNYGRVYSSITNQYLTPVFNSNGYYMVVLMTDSGRSIKRYIHRLVADAFVPGKDVGLDVNHEDGIKTNNLDSNLGWMTRKENVEHAIEHGLMIPGAHLRKRVRIVETGEVYESQAACARAIGGAQASIFGCLSGRLKSHRGFTFEYVD